ncbi:MAG TPA: DNA polymerase III subunit gamma/tau [Tissierellaceae bacterium]
MYQALYRKYRPKSFDDLLGQEHVNTTLKNQIKNDNIGHAYLFSGTRGTGKTSAAKIFSRAVNCLDPVDGNPCNKCSNCLEILEESTMDVIEMDAASNNSVEDIRDLREKVIYPPAKIKKKVYIIDEVHMLSKGAFNALLKTLEEPPKHLIFILATTEPERLPQTILSRCQRFDFKRITNKDIILNMQKIIENEDVKVDIDVLKLIARNSDGAMRDALSLLDQCISFDKDEITYEDAIDILGVTNIDLIFDLVDDINNKDMEKTLMQIDKIIQDGKDIQQFIKDLIVHFRNIMIVKSSNDSKDILEIDNFDRYKEQANNMDLDFIMNCLDLLTEAEGKTKWTSQGRIILEMVIIKMVQLTNTLSLIERLEKVEDLISTGNINISNKTVEKSNDIKGKIVQNNNILPSSSVSTSSEKIKDNIVKKEDDKNAGKVEDKKVENSNPEVTGDIDLNTIKKEWKNILERIRTEKINIYALIMEGTVVDFYNNVIVVNYDDGFGFHKEAVSSEKNKTFVEGIVSSYFGRDLMLDFTIGKKKVINEEQIAKENTDIEKAIDLFGEDIVNIK